MASATDAKQIADDELLITREFEAPLALMWRIWEDRDHMKRWWGPEGFTILSLEADFRPGGAWRVHMTSDAYGDSWSSGKFVDIDPTKRIVFTFAWEEGSGDPMETLVTVTFEEQAGKTLQHFHQKPFSSVESRDSHVGGWNSLFNKQQGYVEALAEGEKS